MPKGRVSLFGVPPVVAENRNVPGRDYAPANAGRAIPTIRS
jgi:hypothetical protein